ncbi:MAG: hypothetical protein GF331_23130 [Chitinivibrionales bacterium]|nr:hypothetical protein [Chitinivibrionales bacterium]
MKLDQCRTSTTSLAFAGGYSALVVLLVVFAAPRAQLTRGAATLGLGDGIFFDTQQTHEISADYACTEPYDFVYSDFESCCLATCCHCGLRFASSGELYFSKAPYDSSSFDGPLILSDTVAFTPGDTASYFAICPDFPGVWQETSCGTPDWERFESRYFVVKTRLEKYALVRVHRVWMTWCEPPYEGCDPIRNSYYDCEVSWVIQENGGTDFSDMTAARPAAGAPALRVSHSQPHTTRGALDLLGRGGVSSVDAVPGVHIKESRRTLAIGQRHGRDASPNR